VSIEAVGGIYDFQFADELLVIKHACAIVKPVE
jgi:hypothetical protein